MSLPIATAITATFSLVGIAFATLLDHYHYGSQSLRSQLQRWLNATARIRWDSLAQITAQISLKTDSSVFGPKLISARSVFVASVLLIAATAISAYVQARQAGPLLGVIILSIVFGSISIPLGLCALHLARWYLRLFAPRASVFSSVTLACISVLTAQIILLLWIAIFSAVVLAFLTVCYIHSIYLTDSGPIAALLIILALVYATTFLPAALFPLTLYFCVGAVILALGLASTISRIITNFLKSQLDSSTPKVFTDGAKLAAAFLTIIALTFDVIRQTSFLSRLGPFETELQHRTMLAAGKIAQPICDRFVVRPTELHLYIFASSFFLQASGKLLEQQKLTPEFMNRVYKSFGKRWNEHLYAPLPAPQPQPSPHGAEPSPKP